MAFMSYLRNLYLHQCCVDVFLPFTLQSLSFHLLYIWSTIHWKWIFVWGQVGVSEYDIIDFHNMFLLYNADVHFSNILSKALIWFVPPEHCMEAENHFYIRVCCAEGKIALAWKRLEISHLKALFSPPQPKHFTEMGQRSPTVKTKPKLHSAPAKKLSRVETQSSPTGLLHVACNKWKNCP